jgi:hypothetical protein
MVTFAEFIEKAASRREFVNVLFEERVVELIGTFQQLSMRLEQAGVPHELVGGSRSSCTLRMQIPLTLR